MQDPLPANLAVIRLCLSIVTLGSQLTGGAPETE